MENLGNPKNENGEIFLQILRQFIEKSKNHAEVLQDKIKKEEQSQALHNSIWKFHSETRFIRGACADGDSVGKRKILSLSQLTNWLFMNISKITRMLSNHLCSIQSNLMSLTFILRIYNDTTAQLYFRPSQNKPYPKNR
jgi:hypothetical protein